MYVYVYVCAACVVRVVDVSRGMGQMNSTVLVLVTVDRYCTVERSEAKCQPSVLLLRSW